MTSNSALESSKTGNARLQGHSKAAILAQWERAEDPLASLSSVQRESISALSERANFRKIPNEVISKSGGLAPSASSMSLSGATLAVTASTSDVQSIGSASQEPNSVQSQQVLHPAIRRLESSEKRIESGHQFLEWLHQVENNLQFQEDAPYRHFVKQLEEYRDEIDDILSEISKGLDSLKLLSDQYNFVSTKSNSLHTACQHLLEEQKNLSTLSDQVAKRLVYFTDADRISQKLTSTTLSVNSDTFQQLLDRIDECLLYIYDHPSYKQSNVYRIKYKASLSRALAMVRSHVKNVLDTATNAAQPPNGAQVKSSSDSAFTLFYGKFRAQAPRISGILRAIERRSALKTGDNQGFNEERTNRINSELWSEYESALVDCQQMYFSCRGHLLRPSVASAVSELSQNHKRDHCGLVRAGCAFLLHVCEDEYNLFHQFFQNDSDQLSNFLEGLCTVLYDTLRPLVIHINHLETLSELTGILKTEMLEHHCGTHPPHLKSFETVTSQMLQDVQERLVYRAYIYVRTDILGYTPASGDLAYPEKLEMMESIAQSLQNSSEGNSGLQRKNSTSSMASTSSLEVAQINGGKNFSNSPADLHGMWYPPVRRTLVCLSKLYRCLEKEIFQGLSQEALSACISAVANAADQIAVKKTKLDGQLFHIKHLLILREQIAPFHVDFSVREMSLDFSRLKSAAMTLLTKRGEFLAIGSNNAILEFLLEGTPEVKEHLRDSRKDVDKRLKNVCEDLISECTSLVVGPIQTFLAQVDAHRKHDKTLNISRQPWAKPETLQRIISQSQRELKKQFPIIQRAMQLYLANKETEFILFRPIRNNVMSAFVSFLQVCRQDYSQDEQIIIGCPSQEQIALMITSLQIQPKTPRSSVSRDKRSPTPKTGTIGQNGSNADIQQLQDIQEKSSSDETSPRESNQNGDQFLVDQRES